MKRKSADGAYGGLDYQNIEENEKQNSFDLHELLGLDNLSNRIENNPKF